MSVVHRTLIAALCVLLVALAWLVVESAPESAAPAANSPRWVRTRDGWRRAEWHQPHVAAEPRLHPALVAAFVGLASTTALMAFPLRRAPSRTTPASSPIR